MTPLPLHERVYLTAANCARLYDFPSADAFRMWARRHGISPAADRRRYRRTTIDRFLSGADKSSSQVSL
jgi:hypothetical protein